MPPHGTSQLPSCPSARRPESGLPLMRARSISCHSRVTSRLFAGQFSPAFPGVCSLETSIPDHITHKKCKKRHRGKARQSRRRHGNAGSGGAVQVRSYLSAPSRAPRPCPPPAYGTLPPAIRPDTAHDIGHILLLFCRRGAPFPPRPPAGQAANNRDDACMSLTQAA